MDPVQRNTLLMRIAVFLFGCTCYLFLVVMGLVRLRGAPTRIPQLRQSRWGIGLFVVIGGLFILIPLLPLYGHPTPSEIAKERAAPVLLVISGLFFVLYVGWAAREIVQTVRWLSAGRPRPPARPIPDAPMHLRSPTGAQIRRMALTHRARARLRGLRAGRQQRHDSAS